MRRAKGELMMNSPRVAVLLATVALGATASVASAQSKAEIQTMDRNGDGRVTRAEWTEPAGAFRLHDTNKDGVLSGTEVWDAKDPRLNGRRDRDWGTNRTDGQWRFGDLDRNNDGYIARNEWPDTPASFRLLDDNRDNRIARSEYRDLGAVNRDPSTRPANRSTAYQAGYERGLAEGRAAGREDRQRNQGFDLEGQRELQFADSGYDARFGAKPDYQSGYRDAFRLAYREGWNLR
jgi:hypothetical protein